MRGWTVITAMLLMLLTNPVHADVVKNLYLAEVPVESQDRKERQEAIGKGLREVLVRVSGQYAVLTVPAIEAALKQPTRYVQRYRYQTRKIDEQTQLEIRVQFDETTVNKLIRDNNLPVWGRNRPVTLVWLAVDDRKGRKLITADKQGDDRAMLEQQAKQRGMPIRLPLYDLTDRAKLGVSDVWGNFEDRIMDASVRYQTDNVLVGRVYKTYGDTWGGRWTLYSEGRRTDWESNGESMELALLPGVSSAADKLAQRYALVEDTTISPDLVRIQVEGISGLPAYNRVSTYLDSLDVVSRVVPGEVRPDSVIFELTSRRGRVAVAQAISFGHTLVPELLSVTQTKTPLESQPETPSASQPEIPQQDLAIRPLSVDLYYRLVP